MPESYQAVNFSQSSSFLELTRKTSRMSVRLIC